MMEPHQHNSFQTCKLSTATVAYLWVALAVVACQVNADIMTDYYHMRSIQAQPRGRRDVVRDMSHSHHMSHDQAAVKYLPWKKQSHMEILPVEHAYIEWQDAQIKHMELLNKAQGPLENLESIGDRGFLVVQFLDFVGWGNRLPTLVTGAIMAMLTNRTLLVDFPNINNYITCSWNWDFAPVRPKLHKLKQHQVRIDSYDDLRPFLHDNLATSLPDHKAAPLIMFYEIDYSIPMLAVNPHYEAMFHQLFPGGEVYRPMMKLMVRPAPDIEKEVLEFAMRNFAGRYSIGLQMRAEKFKDQKYGDFPSKVFYSLAQTLAMTHAHRSRHITYTQENVTFFIAADRSELYWEAARMLGEDRVCWTNNGIEGERAPTLPGTERSGLVDLFMMAMVDDIVVTHSSTFGITGSAMKGVKAFTVYGNTTKTQPEMGQSWFFRQAVGEPCFIRAGWVMAEPRNAELFMRNPAWMQHMQCHASIAKGADRYCPCCT
mmetsp:Transcript_38088/g.84853  ORF Transcript_38088/g.84853 Transcript_38088/m.84853 type:complete len:486 (+) Transcript_38088:156-1613(+)